MPYEVRWEQAPYLMYLELRGKTTEEEVVAIIDEMLELGAPYSDIQYAFLLINVEAVKTVPPINVLRQELGRLHAALKGKVGMNFVYGMNPYAGFIIELILKLTPARFKSFQTREAAEQFAWQMVETYEKIEATHKADNSSTIQ